MSDIQKAALGAFCLGAILGIGLCAFETHAQPSGAPSAQAQFAAQLATLLSDTIAERDAARAQLAACQAQAKPPQPPEKP